MGDLIKRIRKTASCVHIAVDPGPASDISECLNQAGDRIAELEAKLTALEAELESANRLISAGNKHYYKLVDESRELEAKAQELKAWHIEQSGWCGNCDRPMFKCACENGALLGKEPTQPPATDDGDSSAGGVGSDLNDQGTQLYGYETK